MSDVTAIFGLIGMASIALATAVLGSISKRMGQVTHTPPYYIGLYISSALFLVSVVVRLVNWLQNVQPAALNSDPGSIVLYIGLPALAITLAVIVAWRYWSWLLAERG